MLDLLFCVWLFSLLFDKYSLIGTLSLDNLLAPTLLVLAVFLPSARPASVNARRILMTLCIGLLLYLSYALIGLLKYVNVQTAFMQHGLESMKLFLYFILPLIYVRGQRQLKMVNLTTIGIAVIACISVLMASLGIVHLEIERFEPSRLQIEWMPKAVGFISTYGELTIFVVYTLLLLMDIKRHPELSRWDKPVWKLAIALALLAGILGSQSRNLVLSMGVSMIVFWYFRARTRPAGRLSRNAALNMLVIAGMAISVVLAILLSPHIIDFLREMGGKTGEGTARARLLQYAFAIQMFAANPMAGIPAHGFANFSEEIRQIHNIWLGVAASNGLVGCIIMLQIFVSGFFLNMGRFSDPSLRAQAVLFVSLLGVMFFSANFYPAQSSYVFWTYMGIILSIGRVGNRSVHRREDAQKKTVSERSI